MLPVVLNLVSRSCSISKRTAGSITGSRTAGTLGRVPLESVFRNNEADLEKLGFCTERSAITAMAWVDNIYVFGRTASTAMRAMKIIEAELVKEWSLALKPDSKLTLLPAGSRCNNDIDPDFLVATMILIRTSSLPIT